MQIQEFEKWLNKNIELLEEGKLTDFGQGTLRGYLRVKEKLFPTSHEQDVLRTDIYIRRTSNFKP